MCCIPYSLQSVLSSELPLRVIIRSLMGSHLGRYMIVRVKVEFLAPIDRKKLRSGGG